MRRIVAVFSNLFVRFSARVIVGEGTKVSWLRLRARGGGHLKIGRESIVRCRVDFDSQDGRIEIGNRCYVGKSHLICHSGIFLGDDVVISWGCTIVDHDSHSIHWKERERDVLNWRQGKKDWSAVRIAPVTIEDKVWIGFGVSILKGVTIGEGAVVGAGSVVTRSIPACSVVAGNPARVVRTLGCLVGRA